MDQYDVIVEKTVRDLFKSSALIQIKKYKMTKEREIQSKNEELKRLILDKYTILINSVGALEEISDHLKELQEIRNQLGIHIKSFDFEEIEDKLSSINFNENILREDRIEESYDFEEQFHKGYVLLNEKKYSDIISLLRDIKVHNKELQGFQIDNYEYLKVELVEGLMKELIGNAFQIESIGYYYKTFEVIYTELLFGDNSKGFLDKLLLSEFYLKISYDDNVIDIFNKYFANAIENDDNNHHHHEKFGYTLVIRLLILKLSQCFALISKSKDNEFTKEDNAKCLYELYLALLSIFKVVKEYQKDIDYDKNKHMSDFISFIKSEITNSLSSLYTMPKGSTNTNTNINMTLKPIDIIQFWVSVYNQMYQLYRDNEVLLSSYNIKEGDNTSLIELLFNDKVIDQISNVIQYRTTLYSFEYFSSLNQTSHNTLEQNNNKKNTIITIQPKAMNSNTKENELYVLLQAINSISIPQFSTVTNKIIQIQFNQLKDLLTEALNIFNKEKEMNNITNSYLEFIINNFNHTELRNTIKAFNLNQLIVLISSIEDIYLKTNYLKIKEFMVQFETYLFNESFSSEDSDSTNATCSDSLKELMIFLQSIEINQSEYKQMIFNLIFSSYEKQIRISIQEQIINPKLIVDLNLLSRIIISQSNSENSSEPMDFSVLIKLIEEKFNIHNTYDDNIEIIGKRELNNFFCNETYPQDEVNFILKQNKKKKEKRELINCGSSHTKLNVYFIDKSIGGNTQKKKTAIQGNSTSKILEHRIDENYLSLKTNKTNQGNPTTIQSQNSNSFLTGKFFNLKN